MVEHEKRDSSEINSKEADVDPDLRPQDSEDSSEDPIDKIETEQEYIKITPVRQKVNSDTVIRELYGLHKYGKGRKMPLDAEQVLPGVTPAANFELLIYKPPGEPQFQFYMGPGESGDVDCDRLESTTRSQYPEDFQFNRIRFDITDVFDDIPHMVRYDGVGVRRRDWMTTLTTFDTELVERSPLSNLLETIIQSDGAAIFQVVFEPRFDWTAKAERHKGRLKRGVHTTGGMVIRSVLDAALGVSDEEKQERHKSQTPEEVGGTIHDTQAGDMRSGTSRMGQIDLKDPSHTYNVTIRAAAGDEHCAHNLTDSLNHLSGKFYNLEGQYLGNSESEYKRMLNHGLTRPNGLDTVRRRKPMLVCNIDELSNFITVPSIDALPKASRGGTGGLPSTQSPLTSPNEEVFKKFSKGMTIGHCITALREDEREQEEITAVRSEQEWYRQLNLREAISLSASDLTHHYLRAATTGSGKTVATLNDMLTAYNNLKGPTILVDPKDGDMCENYLRCHKTLFGNLDDVEYIKIPEKDGQIPGIPFFDLRPLTEGGDRERDTAKQDIIDHYFQLLRYILGADTVDQAFVANEILTNIIRAKFNEKYGSDYFSIGELMEAAQRYQKYGKMYGDDDRDESGPSDEQCKKEAIPRTTDDQVTSILESHLEKDRQQFMNTTDAVLNRIRKIKERDFIWDMLSFKVEDEYWNDAKGWYDRAEIPMLDLKTILNSNKVVLLDTGELRGESSEVFTVLFLSHLWTAAQSLWTPDDEDYIANVIIEESANIARNEIVYRELLPKGREFNLSLGLIMQYPEQVLGENPRENKRSYKEILNNVNTKIIGNVATDDLLVDSLFHEDLDQDEIKDRISGLRRGEWVVQLPSTGFHEAKPEILTLDPLPIPPGHSEGPFDVQSESDMVRERSRELHCVDRDHHTVDHSSGTDLSTRGDNNDDLGDGDEGSADGENEETPEDIDDIEAENAALETEHKAFLELVYDALTDGAKNYTLSQPMTDLPFSEAGDELVEWGYLEKTKLGNNEIYYKPTKRADNEMDRDLSPEEGGEYGGESALHRIAVRLTATYYQQEGYDVEMYHTPQGTQDKIDVYAAPTDQSPDDREKYVEIETSPEKKGHAVEDYKTLSAFAGADAVWVVENFEAADTLFQSLSAYAGELPSPSRHRSFEKINEILDKQGATEIHSVDTIRKLID